MKNYWKLGKAFFTNRENCRWNRDGAFLMIAGDVNFAEGRCKRVRLYFHSCEKLDYVSYPTFLRNLDK